VAAVSAPELVLSSADGVGDGVCVPFARRCLWCEGEGETSAFAESASSAASSGSGAATRIAAMRANRIGANSLTMEHRGRKRSRRKHGKERYDIRMNDNVTTPNQAILGGSFTLRGASMTVRRMGYGAMQLAGPGVYGPPRDPEAAQAVLREAVAAG